MTPILEYLKIVNNSYKVANNGPHTVQKDACTIPNKANSASLDDQRTTVHLFPWLRTTIMTLKDVAH